jgi:Putative adhesin
MEMLRKAYETEAPPELELRLPAGEITLDSHDAPQTEVELEPLDDAAAEILSDVRVELREGGSRPRLVVDVPERRGAPRLLIEHGSRSFGLFGRTPSFALRIVCPHRADANVRTKSAELSSRGLLGSLDMKSQSGDAEVREVDGRTLVQTASGDVEVGRVGGVLEVNTVSGDVRVQVAEREARINSVSGDVELQRVDGALETNSVSGDQRLSVSGGGSVALQSVSGDLDIGIVRGVSVWLDVRSMSGDTSSDLESAEGPPGEGPSIELRANTVSGDIRIHRTVATV